MKQRSFDLLSVGVHITLESSWALHTLAAMLKYIDMQLMARRQETIQNVKLQRTMCDYTPHIYSRTKNFTVLHYNSVTARCINKQQRSVRMK